MPLPRRHSRSHIPVLSPLLPLPSPLLPQAAAAADALVEDLVSALLTAFDGPAVLEALAIGGVSGAAAGAVLDGLSLAVIGACEESFRAAALRKLLPPGGGGGR